MISTEGADLVKLIRFSLGLIENLGIKAKTLLLFIYGAISGHKKAPIQKLDRG
jgi:hypothetical protein